MCREDVVGKSEYVKQDAWFECRLSMYDVDQSGDLSNEHFGKIVYR